MQAGVFTLYAAISAETQKRNLLMAKTPVAKKATAKPAAKKATTPAKTAAKPAAKTAAAKKPVARKAAAPKAAPKATAAKAAPKPATTVTMRQLSAEMAEAHGLTKKQSEEIFSDLADRITKRLKKGERFRLNGLGTLEVRKRPARMGRNPATGESIKIKASKKVAFRVAKELKESV
jgi:DNA-binding protein HU-beta|tara:strand:- start:408 stop:938 length:531 start_codon:yes stop_codon:yes gene_type:complete